MSRQTVPNYDIGTDTARLSLLTNGGFEIWQRGNGPFTANSAWSADRWQISLGGGSSISVSRDTTNVDASSQAAAAVSYTHSASSNIQQLQEGYLQLRGRTVTFSMRVRVATANAVRLGMWDSVNSYRYSSYHTGDGTYQTLTLTAPIAATTTAFVVYVFFDASCTAYLDNAMLVVGAVAADYAPLHPADDLARCLRYYETFSNANNDNIWATGLVTTVSAAQIPLRYRAIKAVTATVTGVTATNMSLTQANGGFSAITSFSSDNASASGCRLMLGCAGGLVAGNATYLLASAAGAGITIEANP